MKPDDSTERTAGSASPPLATSLVIRVVAGIDVGAELVIDDAKPQRQLVGRSPACDLKLADAGISRRHLALEIEDGVVRVTDVDSTNGSTINGIAIGQAQLRGGETIKIGNTTLEVRTGGRRVDTLPPGDGFGRMLGVSREMGRLYPLCRKLAVADVPVLIEGETGTGKEVLAESLHDEGPRSAGPFVVFDCTTVAPALLEAELFGHERGAFTGAAAARAGVFEQAAGGTLLIDEIGDLDLSLQAKLLRAVERREVKRIGGQRAMTIDVRILSATRRDLDREVQAGRFRDDLFHRLAVARIELPPLRKRKGDLAMLVRAIIRQLGGSEASFGPELIGKWEAYGWPGNVRELRNAVARRLALGELADFEPQRTQAEPTGSARTGADNVDRVLALGLPLAESRQLVVDDFERRFLERVLAAHDGNVTRAAESSGIARRHFHRMLARFRT